MLLAALRHAGGLRIDHVLGLNRLWLVPEGASATEGAYLQYPLQDLLRLIALESHRHRAVVIGEDLGTVPDGLRERLSASGVLGMRVLWFQREHGLFIEPTRWPRGAMATTTTHDLPTVAGWWQERDIDWRLKIGELSAHQASGQRSDRARDREALLRAFRHAGLPAAADPDAVVDSAVRFVARTSSALAIVPMEDIARCGRAAQPARHHRSASQLAAAAAASGGAAARVRTGRAPPGQPARGARRLMAVPVRATARLQLHKDFTLDDAAQQVAYFAALGISQSMPVADPDRARPARMHGYDVVDHGAVNPELGGEAGAAPTGRAAAGACHGADRGHRAQPHGGGRRRQRLVAGPARMGPRQSVRALLRHRLGRAGSRAPGPGAGAIPGQTLRRGAGRRGDPPVLRRRRRALSCAVFRSPLSHRAGGLLAAAARFSAYPPARGFRAGYPRAGAASRRTGHDPRY